MNAGDISRLYGYVIESRRKFLEVFRELGWEEFTRNHEASWNSLQGIYIHILEVEESWLHYDIPSRPWPFGDRDPTAFKNFEQVEAYERELTEKTRRLITNLASEDLCREVIFWEGQRKGTVADILIHTFIDEVSHIGEFVCLLWQMNVKPPFINWTSLHSNPP